MFELWHQPEVCEHSGPAVDSKGQNIPLPAESPRDSDRLLRYWIDRSRAGTGFRWAAVLSASSRFVGAVGFNSLGVRPEYAYHFVPKYWGAGLASEASRISLSWAFSRGSECVEAFIEPANVRSLRLAKRLGFERSDESKGGPARYVVSRGLP
jgi:RimJ/RimL family protein N-acetyltransferase